MCETIPEEDAETAASGAHPGDADRSLDNFPLLQTRFVTALTRRSRTARFLVSSSPAFRLLMFGSSISMLGSRISTVAFPMLVLHLNHSPLVTGLVAFVAIAPSMLVYVPAGVLVDRWNPRRVMLVSEFLRGFTIASVVIELVIFNLHVNIWFLICAMIAEEILEIFSTLADRRYLSRLMERDKITKRQASIEVRAHAVVLAGRPVGPFLFVIEPFLPFLADAVSFVASVASLLLLRRIDEPQREARQLTSRKVLDEIVQGFLWLSRDRRSLLTVFLLAITSMVAQALILMFLVLAHSRQLSTVAIGVVLAASGAGGAVGSLFSRIVLSVIRGIWLPLQMVAWSVVLAFLALAGGQSVYLSAIAMFFLGFTGAIGNVEFGTYLVRNVTDDMIAKVTGIGQMLAIGACALGPVLGGYAIQRYRVQGTVSILLGIVVLFAFASLLMTEVPERMRLGLDSFKRILAAALASQGGNPSTAEAGPVDPSDASPELNPGNDRKFILANGAISLSEAKSRL
jgi:MFS family permease